MTARRKRQRTPIADKPALHRAKGRADTVLTPTLRHKAGRPSSLPTVPIMPLTPVFLPTALSPSNCERLIAEVSAAPLRDAGLVKGTTAHQIRRADIAWLDDLPQTAWAMEQMITHVSRANRDDFGFELTDFGESAQVARYGAEREGHFDWHSDIGAGAWAARRKLTVVVQLSDPGAYEGGALELRAGSAITEVPRARGLATIFPAFMLHRVTPVTAGTRWSLTLWAHGPNFR